MSSNYSKTKLYNFLLAEGRHMEIKKIAVFLFLALISPARSAFALFQPINGIESSQIQRVSVSDFDKSLIYVASRNSLYKSQDSGKSFRKVSVFKDEDIQHMFFDPYLVNRLYIVTSRHLYEFDKDLKQLYTATDEETIYSAEKHKGVIYIGTSKGLYSANQDFVNWKKSIVLGELAVNHIDSDGDSLYLASEEGAYSLINDEGRFKRLFVMRRQEESQGLVATFIKTGLFNKETIFLGTNQGVFVSSDRGFNWRKLYIEGIDNLYINCISQSKLEHNTVYIATSDGFFRVDLNKNSAKQLFEGLYSSDINWIEFTHKGKIYLATSKGLFYNDYFTLSYESDSLEGILQKEPSIREIQIQALRYNEVHPQKIQRWRKALRYRALLPSVSLDYDKTINYDSSDDRYYTGPHDWGVTFSWDIADLVWDIHEDDVDTRARLNTQLRLDILDDINRVYYERIRLIREIVAAELSEAELFKKKLRLQELTAILDGYTGGYCSRRIKELSEKR